MFERFTDRARRSVVLAEEEARALDHTYIGQEHLLLGLLAEGQGVAAVVLGSYGISLEAARHEVERIIGRGKRRRSRGRAQEERLLFAPRAKRTLEQSLQECLRLGHNYIGTEHLILGMVATGGIASALIEQLGATPIDVRERLYHLLTHGELPDAARPLGAAAAADTGLQVVPDIAAKLRAADTLDVTARGVVASTVEQLLGHIRYHLDEGTWSHANGYDYGVEEEIAQDLRELERHLNPITNTKPPAVLVTAYVHRLAGRALELAASDATQLRRARIDHLRSSVLDSLVRYESGADDLDSAVEAIRQLAFATAWKEVPPVGDAEDGQWVAFVEYADDHRLEVAAAILGWRGIPRHEMASAVLGSLTGASGFGFMAQSVGVWAGASTGTGAAVGAGAGLIGAIAGALLGVTAARFVRVPD